MNTDTERTCPDCQGSGMWSASEICDRCQGTGTVAR